MGRKSTNKTRTNSPEKKEELVRQLIPFFQKNGLKGISMDDMARAMNISKATVYKYFHSREEILSATLFVKLEEIREFEKYLNDIRVPYLERYKNAVQHLSHHLSDITTLFLADLKHIFPHIWQLVEDFKDYCMSTIKTYYSKGIKEGYFNDINPTLMVLSDQFFINVLSDPDYLQANKLTIQQAFDEYFRMKFYGIMK